ncbi:hypothetical protein [Streptomyces sp. I6]|uniref:hypothetical protein n=1 Tax=Streptomyces sp. I6 TaxID=2483113 RepID=UPI001617DA63|nr:hypothetical protein [Streptomyces sp. I6]
MPDPEQDRPDEQAVDAHRAGVRVEDEGAVRDVVGVDPVQRVAPQAQFEGEAVDLGVVGAGEDDEGRFGASEGRVRNCARKRRW